MIIEGEVVLPSSGDGISPRWLNELMLAGPDALVDAEIVCMCWQDLTRSYTRVKLSGYGYDSSCESMPCLGFSYLTQRSATLTRDLTVLPILKAPGFERRSITPFTTHNLRSTVHLQSHTTAEVMRRNAVRHTKISGASLRKTYCCH